MEDQQPLLEKSLGDEDSLWFVSPGLTPEDTRPDLMVYFVPGNPCIMSYYELFLSHLSVLLNEHNDKYRPRALVGGSTLPGFQLSHPSTLKGTLPAGLEDEILNVEELLAGAIVQQKLRHEDDSRGKGPKVILMAHSVGAYMVLEVLRRRAQRLNTLANLDIIGAVLLFPTVTEIAQSWHGSILSIFHYIPYFPAIVAAFSKMVTFFLPISIISWIICFLGSMPAHIGKATAEFLKSPMGVYQALHLTIDEIRMIRHDSWDETVWGPSMTVAEKAVPLRFYFGEQDVWVSNKARDKLIASRASHDSNNQGTERPIMVIDNENIPHGFIIDHSKRIAEKAKSMIEELLNLDNNKINDDSN